MRSTSRWLLLLALSCALFNAFAFTASTKVMEWDEARRGVAAFEMLERGDFTVHRYRGEVDTFSVKPPLGLWAIAASYRVFGFNRFALRFPSGLAAVLTVVVVAGIAFRLFGGDAAAVAALVLATTPPFFLEHSARGGEYDAPLAFLIAALFAAVLFARHPVARAATAGVLLGAIVLLKSFAVAIPIGVLATAALLTRERRLLWRREVAIAGAVALALVVGLWVVPRLLADGGGFFARMVDTDLVSRTTQPLEGHGRPWYWYLTKLVRHSVAWTLLLVVAVAAALRNRDWLRRGSFPEMVIASWAVVPILIATLMQTKLAWYVNPVYPCLALLTARLVRALPARTTLALVIAAALVSEVRIVRKITKARELPPHERHLLALELPPGSAVYAPEWSQAAYFVARVERGYLPRIGTAPR